MGPYANGDLKQGAGCGGDDISPLAEDPDGPLKNTLALLQTVSRVSTLAPEEQQSRPPFPGFSRSARQHAPRMPQWRVVATSEARPHQVSSTPTVDTPCSSEEMISLDLRNSSLDIPSRISQTLNPLGRMRGIRTRWHRLPPSSTDPSNLVPFATESGLASLACSAESPSLTRTPTEAQRCHLSSLGFSCFAPQYAPQVPQC